MKKIMLLTLLIISGAVSAGEHEGKITSIVVRGDGAHYVNLSGDASGRASCHNGNFDIWVIKDEKSDLGKSQFAMLLAAYTSGNTVKIIGTNSCTRWHDAEDIDYVVLK